jgi:hypothetical protein
LAAGAKARQVRGAHRTALPAVLLQQLLPGSLRGVVLLLLLLSLLLLLLGLALQQLPERLEGAAAVCCGEGGGRGG